MAGVGVGLRFTTAAVGRITGPATNGGVGVGVSVGIGSGVDVMVGVTVGRGVGEGVDVGVGVGAGGVGRGVGEGGAGVAVGGAVGEAVGGVEGMGLGGIGVGVGWRVQAANRRAKNTRGVRTLTLTSLTVRHENRIHAIAPSLEFLLYATHSPSDVCWAHPRPFRRRAAPLQARLNNRGESPHPRAHCNPGEC